MRGPRLARLVGTALLAASIGGHAPAGAKDDAQRLLERSWKEKLDQAREARDDQQYKSAHAALAEALEIAKQIEARPELVPETLDETAKLFNRQWSYDEAILVCEQAITLRSKLSETPLLERGYCNYTLSYFYGKVEAWDKAEALARARIEQLQSVETPDEEKIRTALSALATLLTRFRIDDPEIETLLVRLQRMAVDAESEVRAISQLASYYRHTSRFEEAAAAYADALELAKTSGSEPDLSSRQINLARSLESIGEYERAETLLRAAVATREELLGPNDLQLADAVFRLGRLLAMLERYDEAEPLLRRAVEVTEAAFGDDAGSYEYRRRELREVQAQLGLRPAEPVDEAEAECECPYDWRRVAELTSSGQRAEALRLLAESLALTEATEGPDSLMVAEVLHKMGSLESQIDPITAAETYEREMRILDQQVEPGDERITTTAERLYSLYWRLLDYDRATEYALLRVENLRVAGGRRYSLAKALEELGKLRRAAKDEADVLEYFGLAADLWAAQYGEQSSRVLELRLEMGWSYVSLGRYEDAETWLIGLRETMAAGQPEAHHSKRLWHLLARVYRDTGRESEAREASENAALY